jgi:hypothetical protein
MSLEQAIAALTAAVEANTAALQGSGAKPAAPAPAAPAPAEAAAPAAGKRGPGRPKKEDSEKGDGGYKPQYDKTKMMAVLNEVKEQHGVADAKKIIKEVGKADKMADIVDPKLIDDCYLAAKALLDGGDGEDGDDDDM